MDETLVKRTNSLDPQMPHGAKWLQPYLLLYIQMVLKPDFKTRQNKNYNELLSTCDTISIVIDLIIQIIRRFCSTDLCLLQVFHPAPRYVLRVGKRKMGRSLFSTSLKAGRCEYTGCWDLVGPLSRSKGDWATIYQLQTITCLLHNILQNLYRFSPKSLWPYKLGALLYLWWVVLQVARLASTLNGVCQYRNLDLIR